jgi:phage-related protein
MEKSILNFKIQHKDGSEIDLHEDKNLWVSTFHISSPSPEHTTEKIEGRHGAILLESTLAERKITASFLIEDMSPVEFDLFRDELFRIFNPLNKLYFIRDLQPNKRMEVSIDSEFNIDYITLEDGEFTIDFILHSIFLESVNRIEYKHTSNFSFHNIGDQPIDMVEQNETEIEFVGASDNLIIRNARTGDEWRYNGTTTESDVILLKGVRSTKNGVSIFGNTNKKILTFAPGWNDIQIEGATDYTITIRTRFYYI